MCLATLLMGLCLHCACSYLGFYPHTAWSISRCMTHDMLLSLSEHTRCEFASHTSDNRHIFIHTHSQNGTCVSVFFTPVSKYWLGGGVMVGHRTLDQMVIGSIPGKSWEVNRQLHNTLAPCPWSCSFSL